MREFTFEYVEKIKKFTDIKRRLSVLVCLIPEKYKDFSPTILWSRQYLGKTATLFQRLFW